MQNNVGIEDAVAKNSTVIVTGFGPFKHHKINASWEAVKLLPSLNLDEKLGIKLIVEEIPVSYDAVSEKIPKLWEMHNPLLVVHVGVSSHAKVVIFERSAYRSGYWKEDVEGKTPENGCCPRGTDECITSALSIHEVCSEVNKCDQRILSCISSDAGRYLCEFIYYTSLSIDRRRTIFIHVPELERPYSAMELAEGISKAVESMISQRRCSDVSQ
ncbi:hypothetical protein J437_LFUL007632 [Ladona fulva]|uniref:Pyroglutamyl-peptidase I n=1 Tax=Ladona fulva TaxID=123851 RepID=A0A8K0K5S3_LADFU|nr:hypothetical protein J437_LFUL007632 [Ladona fulva]